MKLRWKILFSFLAIMCGLFALALASPYWFWYPTIPWADLKIDGRLSKNLALYWHRSGRTLVLTRHLDGGGRETYFVNIGDPKSQEKDFSRSFVASCTENSIFVYRLIAAQNHEQLCTDRFFGVDDPDNKRKVVVGHRSFEFDADDGKRITATW
jgi:hypothetical protein